MERFTYRCGFDDEYVSIFRDTNEQDALKKLAAYEDTGLTPDEIMSMKADRDASIEGLRVLNENIEELKRIVDDYIVRYSEMQDENAGLKAEKDKAVEDLEELGDGRCNSEFCNYCKYRNM